MKSPLQSFYGTLNPMIGAYAYFVCAGLVLVALMLLTEATYRLIEIPAIRLGRTITMRIRRRAELADTQLGEQPFPIRSDACA